MAPVHQRARWLRPVWALLFGTLLTAGFVSSQGPKLDLSNWIAVNDKFPSTTSTKNAHQIDQFYYRHGVLQAEMFLKKSVKAEIAAHPASGYQVHFEVFRSKGACERFMKVPPDLKTEILENEWIDIKRSYSAQDLANFNIIMTLRNDLSTDTVCQANVNDYIYAIKDLTLTYNNYTKGESDQPSKDVSLFKATPELTAVEAKDRAGFQYFFSGCSKEGTCSLVIPQAVIAAGEVKMTFWHETAFEYTDSKGAVQKGTAKQPALLTIPHDGKSTADITVHLTTTDNTYLAGSLGALANYKDVKGALKIENNAGAFFVAHKSAKMIENYSKTTFVLLNEGETFTADLCYKFFYLIDGTTNVPSKFSLSIEIPGGTTDKPHVNRYSLFDLIPQAIDAQVVNFCLRDFLYKTELIGKKIQLKLTSEASVEDSTATKARLAFVAIEEAKTMPAFKAIGFIQEKPKTPSAKWDAIVETLAEADIPVNPPTPLTTITLTADTERQSYQLQGVWLKRDLKLTVEPARVAVKISQPNRAIREKFLKDLTIEGRLCDELMECVIRQADISQPDPAVTSYNYAFSFDPHPSASQYLRLVLYVVLPAHQAITEVELDLQSFGDPCDSQYGKCPAQGKECTATNAETDSPNDFEKGCSCAPGTLGDKCQFKDHCASPDAAKCFATGDTPAIKQTKCRNSRDNAEFECICNPAKPADILKKADTGTTCKPDPAMSVVAMTSKSATETTWTFDLSGIYKEQYDVCYHFASGTKDQKGRITFDLNNRELGLVRFIDQAAFADTPTKAAQFDTCLGDWFDLATLVTEKAQLIITVSLDKEHTWTTTPISTTGQKHPETKGRIPPTEPFLPNLQISSVAEGFKVKFDKVTAGKQEISIVPVATATVPTNTKTSIFGGWIAVDPTVTGATLDLNRFDFTTTGTGLTLEGKLCRPRSGADDCQTLSPPNTLQSILTAFTDATKFQLVLEVTTNQDFKVADLKAIQLSLETSFWEPCTLHKKGETNGCQNGVCKPSTPFANANSFICTPCATGFTGRLCHIPLETCSETQKTDCIEHGGKCDVPKAGPNEGKAVCACPPGYQANVDTQDCERNKIDYIKQVCSANQPDDCFMENVNGLLNPLAPFAYLPRNFPLIGASTPASSRPKYLYYSTTSESTLGYSIEDADSLHRKAADACIHFRYYVAPSSQLTLRLNDDLDLLTIDGIKLADSLKADGSIDETKQPQISLALSEPTKVCIGDYLPVGKLSPEVTSFKLNFVATIGSKNDAVAVELVPTTNGQYVEYLPQAVRETVAYLARQSKDLNITDAKTAFYQWPAHFPSHRWSELNNGVEFARQETEIETIERAIIESTWIERPLGTVATRASPLVYLNFKVNPMLNVAQNHIKIDILLLDSARRQLGPRVASLPIDTTKTAWEFSIPVDKVTVAKDVPYKVQLQITYRNVISKLTKEKKTLFTLTEISFGDPCIQETDEKGNAILPINRQCYDFIVEEVRLPKANEPQVECMRIPQASGQVDYQCKCRQVPGALQGANCHDANYCLLAKSFTTKEKDSTRVNLVKAIKGDAFCAKDKTANCVKGRLGLYDFKCKCTDQMKTFNFYAQKCEPIDICILQPCDFATQDCTPITNGTTPQRSCSCKAGFREDPAASDKCTPIPLTEQNCTAAQAAECGPTMKCLAAGPGMDKYICECEKGFRYVEDQTTGDHSCVRDACAYEGLQCTQGCTNVAAEPFFECTCGANYELKTETGKQVCTLKKEAETACKDCTGLYQICTGGAGGAQCTCAPNFELKENVCVPKATTIASSCPGPFKLNDQTHEYECDCAEAAPKGFFKEDHASKATCTLAKSMCDPGEAGQLSCASRNAGCLVDPDALDSFTCLCPVGKLFPDSQRSKKAIALAGKRETVCLNVCELPYRESACAAIGGTCNAWKLWQNLTSGGFPPTLKAEEYCVCVPGTFYDETVHSCVQETEALTFELTFQWSKEMQEDFESKRKEDTLREGPIIGYLALMSTMKHIDPIGFAQAQIKAVRGNLLQEAKESLEDTWNRHIRQTALDKQLDQLLADFKIISKEGLALKREITILAVDLKEIEGKVNYVLRLATKIPESFKAATVLADDQSSGDGSRFDSFFNEIIANCHALTPTNTSAESNCIISYLSLVLGHTPVSTQILKPCEHAAGTCQAHSDCVPVNSTASMFECKCNDAYFTVESRYAFQTAKRAVTLLNEMCTSKPLCGSKCTGVNTACIEKDPVLDVAAHSWTKEVDCSCKDKYIEHAHGNGTRCTSVCEIKDCILANGHCDDSQGPAVCTCKEDFYGPRCEHAHSSNTWWIVAVVVLGVLTVAGIGAAAFFFMKAR